MFLENVFGDEDIVIKYFSKFREFGIPVPGSESIIVIQFCPWCGAKLPPSLRLEWFNCIYAKYGDDIDTRSEKIDKEFNSELWWRKREL